MSEEQTPDEQPKNQLVPYQGEQTDNKQEPTQSKALIVIPQVSKELSLMPDKPAAQKENIKEPPKTVKEPKNIKKFIPGKGALVSAFSGIAGGVGIGTAFTMGTMALGGGTGNSFHTTVVVAGVAAVSAIIPKMLANKIAKNSFNRAAFFGSVAGAAMLTTGAMYNDANVLKKEFFHNGIEQIQSLPQGVLKTFGIKIK